MFSHSNEVEEVAVVNLSGVNLEVNPEMEALLGVRVDASCSRPMPFSDSIKLSQKRFTFTLFTSSN